MANPKKAEGDELTGNEATKTLNFPKDGELLRRVQAFAEKSKVSLNKACMYLLEHALNSTEKAALAPVQEELVGAFSLDGFPPWLQTAVKEAASLTGLGIKGTLLDLDRRYMRDYLEVVRSEAETMTKFLTSPSVRPALPDSLSK